jgi:hypothetical protein
MSSEEAAEWLIDRYPAGGTDWGDAIAILPHRSWKTADQVRLAHHYLRRLPFASAKAYEALASFMRISRFIAVLTDYVPDSDRDRDLFNYYVGPVLARAAKTPEDHEAVQRFMRMLKQA